MTRPAWSGARRGALVLEIVWTYARVRWWLARLDLPAAVAAARGQDRLDGRGPDPYREGVRLGFAVSRTLALLPSDSRCLFRSLVLTALLARRRVPTSLVIGVRPAPDFGAHAWVEHAGRALTAAGPREYRRLAEL
jgi:hypothetical protein